MFLDFTKLFLLFFLTCEEHKGNPLHSLITNLMFYVITNCFCHFTFANNEFNVFIITNCFVSFLVSHQEIAQ